MKNLKELKEKHQLIGLAAEDTDLIRTLELIEGFTEVTGVHITYGKMRRLASEIEIKNYMIDTLIEHIKNIIK